MEVDARRLVEECRTLTRHLIAQEPNDYVVAKYREAHRVHEAFRDPDPGGFDGLLLRFAQLHPAAARLVDTYVSLFFRTSLVRKKTVLLLAILESCAPTHLCFDAPDSEMRMILCLKAVGRFSAFVVALLAATICFLPLHLVFAARARRLATG